MPPPAKDLASRQRAILDFLADFDQQADAAAALRISTSQISKAKSEKATDGRLLAVENAIARWKLSQPDRGESDLTPEAEDVDAVVEVPQYGHVGAGDGRVPPKRVGVLRVTLAEYAQDFSEPPRVIGDRYRPSDRFGYFIIDGDSAAPVFFDRERVPVQLLDPEKSFANDLLYVFRWRGEFQIKRLRLLRNGDVQATSLNPSIEPFYFNVAEEEDFAIVALARIGHKQQLYTALVGRFWRSDT